MHGICQCICLMAVSFGAGLLLALFFPLKLAMILTVLLLIGFGVILLLK